MIVICFQNNTEALRTTRVFKIPPKYRLGPSKSLKRYLILLKQYRKLASIGIVRKKRTKYDVCKNPFTTVEHNLVKSLHTLRKYSVQLYKNRHQTCPLLIKGGYNSAIKRGTASNIKDDFPNLNIKYSFIGCSNSNDVNAATNTFSMCRECKYMIELPESYLHRFHLHVTCDNNGDYSCMFSEGTCVKNIVEIPLIKRKTMDPLLLFDGNNEDYSTEMVSFTRSCSCEIISGNLFSMFV